MGSEFDNPAVFQHANAIGMANRGETMRDENGGAMPGGCEQSIENLRFPADVELRRGLVEQYDSGSQLDGSQRPGERDALPLSARQVGAAIISSR